MPRAGSGDIAGAGRRKGQFVGWNEGLTDADRDGLRIIADQTDRVVAELGKGIARGLEAIGIQAESDCAKVTPVDTGRLRNSITHTIEGGDTPAAIIGTNVEYAMPVHDRVPYLVGPVQANANKYRAILKAALESGGN